MLGFWLSHEFKFVRLEVHLEDLHEVVLLSRGYRVLLLGFGGAFEPGVQQSRRGLESAVWVENEELSYEVFRGRRDFSPRLFVHLELALFDELSQLVDAGDSRVLLMVERLVAAEHGVQHAAGRPHVDAFRVRVAVENLWRAEGERAGVGVHFEAELAERAEVFVLSVEELRDVEVRDLEHLVFGDEQVVRLEVSVDDAVRVQESDAGEELHRERLGDFFCVSGCYRSRRRRSGGRRTSLCS